MNARGHIDEVRFVDPLARRMDVAGTGRVPEGSSAYVRGWGFLEDPPRAPDAVLGAVDDGESFELACNQPRPDVIAVLDLPPMLPIGFHGVRSFADLACGSHVMRFFLLDRASGARAPLEATVAFEIVDGSFAFGATQRLNAGEMTVAVDAFSATVKPDGKDALDTPVRRGATLLVRGWAIDRRYVTAASDVYACVDGRTFVRGIIGTLRSDVSGSIGVATLARCGYVIRIDTSGLEPGNHVVDVRAIAADGDRYATSESLPFAVVAEP